MNIDYRVTKSQIRRRKLFKQIQLPLMLLPVLFVVIGLFGGGLLKAFISGFGYIPEIKQTEFSLKYYIAAFTHPDFLAALFFGLKVSILSIVISTAISLFIAVQLMSYFRTRKILKFIYRFPLQIPWLVITFMILTLFSDGGLVARLCYHLGLIQSTNDFPHLLYSQGGFGIIFVYVWSEIGFVSLVLFSRLLGMDPSIDEAARTLGASRWQLFWKIQLPLMMPSILMVSLLNFAFTFGDYATPQILGPTSPNTLPVVAFRMYQSTDLKLRPQAMAMSVVIALIAAIILVVYNIIMRKQQYTEAKVQSEKKK